MWRRFFGVRATSDAEGSRERRAIAGSLAEAEEEWWIAGAKQVRMTLRTMATLMQDHGIAAEKVRPVIELIDTFSSIEKEAYAAVWPHDQHARPPM